MPLPTSEKKETAVATVQNPCPICAKEITEEQEKKRKISLECGHRCHDECFATWTKSPSTPIVDQKHLPGHQLVSKNMLFNCPVASCKAHYCMVLGKVDVKEGTLAMKKIRVLLEFADGMVECFRDVKDFARPYAPYFMSRRFGPQVTVTFGLIVEMLKIQEYAELKALHCGCDRGDCSRAMIATASSPGPLATISTFAQDLANIETLHGGFEALIRDLLVGNPN